MNQNIAEIIVNNPSSEVDKPFSYLIPDNIIDKISIGSRVLVPFGKGNQKIEGYVINITACKPSFELKEIFEPVDYMPIFNKNMLKLAYWMKNEYMCTLLDCLKCIVPTGIGIKTSKAIRLNPNCDLSKIRGTIQKEIIEVLKNNNNEIYFENLVKILNKNVLSSVNKLSQNGILSIENRLISQIRDKTIKVAMLNISEDDALMYYQNLSDRHSTQKRIIDILIDNDYLALADLIKFADTSYNTVNNLCKKGIIQIEEITVNRELQNIEYPKSNPLKLTSEQSAALNFIINGIEKGNKRKFLIHGVTGSGKTEVYLQSIDAVIKNKGQAIVLVPEISLTPQMVQRFKSRFGERIAVMHSRLSLGERFDQWKMIKEGKVDVAVGARSAIFAPFENLKLIIIDEEHETSYKSENRPRYDAKDIAFKRGELEDTVVVLGSATPLISTYNRAKEGSIELIQMKNRVNDYPLPKVHIADMRIELEEGNRSIFSRKLFDEISLNIENGEQTMLFLNRRGYSTFISCRQCGYVLKCPNCNISLTYHSYNNMLSCHYCGFERRNVSICPSCGGKYIKYFGIGTQRIEEEINKLFPNASVLRMDYDTTTTRYAHQRILDKFKNENINILIGTQMIAKGHDFANVTLVGVVSADTSLNIEDFRASERTFQLLTQVAGRAGRGEKSGRAVIQTYQPENYSIQYAKEHDYINFYDQEIVIRKSLEYPPFSDIISIVVSHNDNNKIKDVINNIEKEIESCLKDIHGFKYSVYKAAPAPISKIKQMYRWRIIIKGNKCDKLLELLRKIELKYYNHVNVCIDVNATNML